MPAAVPALVITRSSSTNSTSGSTVASGKRRCSSSVCRQWVVQARPSSRPASPSRNAPGAHREHPGAAGVRAAEDVEDRLGRRLVVVVGRGDHQVGVLGVGQSVGVVMESPLRISIGSPGRSEQTRKSIGGHAVVGPVDAEHLV